MPIYEYACPDCKKEFEELVFGDDTPECPACGKKNATRLLSCACLHMPGPSRVGQQVTFPKSKGGGCAGCSGGSCSTCI
jgi:putative regulatory protein, FmdB family